MTLAVASALSRLCLFIGHGKLASNNWWVLGSRCWGKADCTVCCRTSGSFPNNAKFRIRATTCCHHSGKWHQYLWVFKRVNNITQVIIQDWGCDVIVQQATLDSSGGCMFGTTLRKLQIEVAKRTTLGTSLRWAHLKSGLSSKKDRVGPCCTPSPCSDYELGLSTVVQLYFISF